MSKRDADPFDSLAEAYGEAGMYLSRCGFLYASGEVRDYTPTTGWQFLHRAVASCFGSMAKRMRGGWKDEHMGSPVAALLAVVDWRGRYVWKQRIELPKENTR